MHSAQCAHKNTRTNNAFNIFQPHNWFGWCGLANNRTQKHETRRRIPQLSAPLILRGCGFPSNRKFCIAGQQSWKLRRIEGNQRHMNVEWDGCIQLTLISTTNWITFSRSVHSTIVLFVFFESSLLRVRTRMPFNCRNWQRENNITCFCLCATITLLCAPCGLHRVEPVDLDPLWDWWDRVRIHQNRVRSSSFRSKSLTSEPKVKISVFQSLNTGPRLEFTAGIESARPSVRGEWTKLVATWIANTFLLTVTVCVCVCEDWVVRQMKFAQKIRKCVAICVTGLANT